MAGLSLNGENLDSAKRGKPADGSLNILLPRRIVLQTARESLDASPGGDFKLETLNPTLNPKDSNSDPSPSTHVVKKSQMAGVLDHNLDQELTLGTGFKKIGAGLANLGNTCFLNSVLQCLTYTEPLAAYLQSGKHKSSCRAAGFCAMCAIQNHVSSALQSSGKFLSPSYLVRNLRSVSTQSTSAYEKSFVHKIFGGRLRSQVKCTQCSYCSNTFDPFTDLSLQIVKADSLRKALVQFTAVEQLDGGEKQYQCAQCKEKVRALKQLTVHKAPHVLTIHLKRFGSGVPGQKIDKKVEFGTVLDLKPYVSGIYEGELKYSLYGVLVHAGWSTHSGHYYCFVRTSSGIWHVLDDNQVNQVSEKYVMEQKAYMLFYVLDRKSFPAKRSFHMSHKVNKVPLVQTCVPIPVNKAMKTNSSHNMGIQNGTPACASLVTKETALGNKKDCSNAVGNILDNSNDEHPELLNINRHLAAAPGCLQPLVQSTNSGTDANVGSGDSVAGKLYNAKAAHASGSGTSKNCISKQSHQELSTILHNGICHLDATKTDAMHINNLDTSRGTISHKVGLKNSTISANGLSISHYPPKDLPKEKTREKSDKEYDKVKVMSFKPDSLQKLAWNGCSYDASKKCNRDKVLLDNQIGGNELGTPDNVPLTSAKQNQSSWPEKIERGDSIKENLPRKSRKRKYLHPMPISLGRMFFTSLSVQNNYKEKQKRQKRVNSVKDGVAIGQINGGNVCGENISHPIPMKGNGHANGTHCEPYVNGSAGSKRKDDGGRENHSGALATSEKKVAIDLTCVRESNQQHQGAIQNKLTDISRSLSLVTVARWDDMEAPESQEVGSFNGKQLSSIGYVLDQWDEACDKGKRKKPRKSKYTSGAENPFQEITTKKAKLDHTDLRQMRSGHQPLRI